MVADPELPASWRKTFMTLWLGCFMTGLNFSMTMPFMALYIETLHPYGKFELNLYAGLAFAVTYLAQAIVSPLWGNLADQKGRNAELGALPPDEDARLAANVEAKRPKFKFFSRRAEVV